MFLPHYNRLQVERGIDLVYGGGSIGLMGLVSRAVHAGGRHVIGLVSISICLTVPHAVLLCFCCGLALWGLGALFQQLHASERQLYCRNGSFGQAGSCWGLGSIARLGEWGQAMPIAFGFTKMEVPFRSSFRKASWFVPCSKWAVMAFMGAHLQAGEQVLAL